MHGRLLRGCSFGGGCPSPTKKCLFYRVIRSGGGGGGGGDGHHFSSHVRVHCFPGDPVYCITFVFNTNTLRDAISKKL